MYRFVKDLNEPDVLPVGFFVHAISCFAKSRVPSHRKGKDEIDRKSRSVTPRLFQ